MNKGKGNHSHFFSTEKIVNVLRKLSCIRSTIDNDIYNVIIHPRTSKNRCVLKKTTMTTQHRKVKMLCGKSPHTKRPSDDLY